MPFGGELKMRLGPLGMTNVSSKFASRNGYQDDMTITTVDADKIDRVFREMGEPGAKSIRVTKLHHVFAELGMDLTEELKQEFGLHMLQGPPESFDEGKSSNEDDEDGDQADSETKNGEQKVDNDDEADKPDMDDDKYLSLEQVCELLAEVYAPSYIYGKELNRAIARGDLRAVDEFVARGCSLKYRDGRGMTALHYACEAGCKTSLEYLLDKLGDQEQLESRLHIADANGWTPLMCAVANNHDEIVKLLNSKVKGLGQDKNDTGRTSLHIATLKGNWQVCESLLQADSSLVREQDDGGMTPVHLAALNNNQKVAEILIKFGGNPDGERENCGRTAREICPDEEYAFQLFGEKRNKSQKK